MGALVTDLMGRQGVEGLAGYHLNLLTAVLAIGDHLPKESEQERAAAEAVATFREDGFGYFLEMATRPQTISYALLDSPVALAAWLLDHDTDSYYKIAGAFVDGKPTGNLTRERIVDNITLYWLTGTAASAARSYWEDGRALAAALASGQPPPPVNVPVGFTTFPGEIWAIASELGRGGLPRPRLLQRGRQGRPLRRLGGARAVHRRGSGGVPVAALGSVFERLRPRVHMPPLDGATGWLNSEPLGPAELRGQGRPRQLLDADLHQLAAPGAVRPRVVAGLPRRRVGRHRSPHAGVLVRARDRPRPAWRRRSEGSTTRSPPTTTTRSGARSTTTTGRRSTSSTPRGSSATTTSAKGVTTNRSA